MSLSVAPRSMVPVQSRPMMKRPTQSQQDVQFGMRIPVKLQSWPLALTGTGNAITMFYDALTYSVNLPLLPKLVVLAGAVVGLWKGFDLNRAPQQQPPTEPPQP